MLKAPSPWDFLLLYTAEHSCRKIIAVGVKNCYSPENFHSSIVVGSPILLINKAIDYKKPLETIYMDFA